MKPRTKHQRLIMQLHKGLPPITAAARKWGIRHALDHKGFKTGKGVVCMDCGHRWTHADHLDDRCPACGQRLDIATTRRVKDWQKGYFVVLAVRKGFQVIRIVEVSASYRLGQPATIDTRELMQVWMDATGRFEIVGLQFFQMGNAATWGGSMEIRAGGMGFLELCRVTLTYPRQNVLPELKRNGFAGEFHFHGWATNMLFRALLTDPHAETLLKAGQMALFKRYPAREDLINGLWPSVRICMRNGYIVQDADMWLDYVKSLFEAGRDILNPHYVCPADLRRQHDRYVRRRRVLLERENLAEQRRKAIEDEQTFCQMRERFFDLHIADGPIEVVALASVQEVMAEGDALHHCVFTNEYHLQKDSLLLSARLDGQRLETVEFSLSRGEVVQCRGDHNQPTPHHDAIVALVNCNKHLIEKRMTT